MLDLNHLFVYGTLRSEVTHEWSRFLGINAVPLGPGRTNGLLFQLDGYPGMVLDSIGVVAGEVYRIEDERIWQTLDDYEGDEFERREVFVRMHDGSDLRAYAYIYRRDIAGKPRIESGNYVNTLNR